MEWIKTSKQEERPKYERINRTWRYNIYIVKHFGHILSYNLDEMQTL